jgi:hypothetical protein
MYNRDGSPRGAWYDPLAFAGLDKEPPPPAAIDLLEHDCARLEQRQTEIDLMIGGLVAELHAIGVQLAGMEGNPHLQKRHQLLTERSIGLRQDLSGLRKERSENEAVLRALRRRLGRLRAGIKDDPHSHIRNLAQPVTQTAMRFNRAAETWGAVSLSVILLGLVALLVLARGYVWMSLVVMVVALLIIESILRGEYARTITGIAAVLAVISAVILILHYWFWVIVALLAVLAFFLLVQKVRELRG